MSTFQWHHINLILKCFPVLIDYKGTSHVSFRHSSLYFRLCIGQINPVKNVHFPSTGSVKRSQNKWKKEKTDACWKRSSWQPTWHSLLCLLMETVWSICSFRVSYHQPRHSPIFMWLDFSVLNPHRQNSLKLCPFWLMSNEFSMCFFSIKLNLL